MIRALIVVAVILLQPFALNKMLSAQERVQMPAEVRELDQQILQLEQQKTKLLEGARNLRLSATDQDRGWKNLMGQIDQIKAQQESLIQQRAAAKKLAAELEAAQQQLKTAEEALEAAKIQFEDARQALEKTSKEAEAASKQERQLEQQVNQANKTLPELIASADQAERTSTTLHQQISDLEKQAKAISLTSAEHQHKIEDLLRSSGQWVSFSQDIAPIFQNRCVPCHNARNSQGRYNMANYAAIMSEGESGLAIEPGDAELSSLYQFVVDGWMPYEADPLEAEQIELIRRWIDLGARLDSAADAEAPLIRIMPRAEQPVPPETYAAVLPITAMAVTPSVDETGNWLASSGYHEVLLWSLPDGELRQRIGNLAERIYGLDFHPNGQWLAVASGTPGRIGEVKIFNVKTSELHADLLVTEDAVFDVAFSPSGDRLAAASADGSVVVFQLSEDGGQSQTVLRIEDHADWVNSVAWSADGKRLVTSSRDKTSKIFDAQTGALQLTFSDHQSAVNAAIFSADGKQVISGGDDRKLRIWSASNGKQQRDIGGFAEPIKQLTRLGNDEVVSADASGRVSGISLADGKQRHSITIENGWLSSLTRPQSASLIYTGNHAGTIQTIDLETWTLGKSWLAIPIAPEN